MVYRFLNFCELIVFLAADRNRTNNRTKTENLIKITFWDQGLPEAGYHVILNFRLSEDYLFSDRNKQREKKLTIPDKGFVSFIINPIIYPQINVLKILAAGGR